MESKSIQKPISSGSPKNLLSRLRVVRTPRAGPHRGDGIAIRHFSESELSICGGDRLASELGVIGTLKLMAIGSNSSFS